jgi:AcrR family transcriptional regulator
MPRWEPNAKERLEHAALDLYATQGYVDTTVSDIADHAGVTSRTYFRYFPDKREVLFGNAAALSDQVARSLQDAAADTPPFGAALEAIQSCEVLFHRREHQDLRRREAVINSSEELQEREARKLRSMASVMADRLERRGTDPSEARLVADLAMVVFVHASRHWMDRPGTRFALVVSREADEVRRVLEARETNAADR